MSDERLWERLLEFLSDGGSAVEVEPGRIEVTLEGSGGLPRVVQILMTPQQWDEMVTVAWGDFGSAVLEVRRALLSVRDHEGFLLYSQYALVPSAAAELPADPAETWVDEAVRQQPGGVGRWVVRGDDGNAVDEFRGQ